MIRLASVSLVAALIAFGSLQGQNPTTKVGIGDACPQFKLPGVDGKDTFAVGIQEGCSGHLITCNHCPVAVMYEDRIIKFTKKFGKKADIIAINVNNGEDDKLPQDEGKGHREGFQLPLPV